MIRQSTEKSLVYQIISPKAQQSFRFSGDAKLLAVSMFSTPHFHLHPQEKKNKKVSKLKKNNFVEKQCFPASTTNGFTNIQLEHLITTRAAC